jgi:hypothetical protein
MGIQPGHIHKPGKIGKVQFCFYKKELQIQRTLSQASFLVPEH